MKRMRPSLSRLVSGYVFWGKGFSIAAFTLSLLLISGCSANNTVTVLWTGGSQTILASPIANQGINHQVIIQTSTFVPLEIDINTGDTVTWVNQDVNSHTVTSIRYFQDEDDISHIYIGETFDSGDISPGQSYSRTFAQEGTYDYLSLPLNTPSPMPEFLQLVAGIAVGVVVVK